MGNRSWGRAGAAPDRSARHDPRAYQREQAGDGGDRREGAKGVAMPLWRVRFSAVLSPALTIQQALVVDPEQCGSEQRKQAPAGERGRRRAASA